MATGATTRICVVPAARAGSSTSKGDNMLRISSAALALLAGLGLPAAHAESALSSHGARAGAKPDVSAPRANPAPAAAATPFVTSLNEGFDDITLLAGNGWSLQNLSTPVGSTNWFQGTNVAAGGPFDALDGAANAYIGGNYNNTGNTGTISNWLMTPVLDFGASATVTFYTRKPSPDSYADRLEVRLSTNGASTNAGTNATTVGDFTTTVLSINPSLVLGVYPTVWTQYTISGLPHSGSGRIAFRYFVTGAGLSGTNSDYVGIDRVTYNTGAPEYKIGGSVSGLAGSGLVLRLNGANDLPVNADGTFEFSPYVTNGGSYDVTVATQPTSLSQTCSVTNGSGTVGATVTNVQVNCVTNSFSIGGSVSGIAGAGLTLQLNGGQDLAQSADGSFVFASPLVDGSAYAVTVSTQPAGPNQTCVVNNGTGTVGGSNIANVQITCTTLTYFIGGSVSGLVGSGLVLHLDGGQDVPVTANGSFMFPNPLNDGSAYSVTVGAAPSNPNQNCTILNGAGILAGGDVTNIAVSCMTLTHAVSGSVYGLQGTGLVLQLNGANDMSITSDGPFAFGAIVPEGAQYAVTVYTQPTGGASYRCLVNNGTGTMQTGQVFDVAVVCDVIFLDGFDLP
jgi:hypothetical protein